MGEVHGDYVKVSYEYHTLNDVTPSARDVRSMQLTHLQNAAGHYQLLSLVVDIPGSHAPQPTRAVVFWSPEADNEGLQGRKR